jgi:hypothetical protein
MPGIQKILLSMAGQGHVSATAIIGQANSPEPVPDDQGHLCLTPTAHVMKSRLNEDGS